MPTTPSKEAQAAEGAARENAALPTIPAGETEIATATIGDVVAPAAAAPNPGAQPDAPQPVMPTIRTLGNDKRAEITARFRKDRGVDAEGDGDDITSFTRNAGLPPEFADAAQPEPAPAEPAAAAPEPAPETGGESGGELDPAAAPAPQMVTITVRGEQKLVTLDEAIALAQRGAATEDTLEQAKAKYKELDQLVAQARQNLAARPAPGEHHAQNGTQTSPTPEAEAPGTPTEDLFGKLLEAMSFGDPEEAKQLFGNTIRTAATQVVQSELQNARFRDEGARAAKVISDFRAAHPELANDDMAGGAIEANLYTQQREDLEKIGVDLSKLREDGQPPTPGDVANAHRWFRVEQGMTSLKTPQQMLESAVKTFTEKYGVKQPNPAVPGAKPLPKAAPVVEVSVDRTARRQAIPQQPSPTAAPRPAPAQPAPQPRDRSSIVQQMKNLNASRRGQSGITA